MKPQLKRKIKIALSPFFRIGLKNKSFSIISNNCWAGYYYDKFHLKYLTPTIGLFFPPKDFLKFLSNLKYYIGKELTVADFESLRCKEMLLRKEEKGYLKNVSSLVIGRLDDIEIIFLHYKSFEEAKEKWDKRKYRINYDNLIVKFNDQNEFVDSDFYEFMNLEYKNKLFFTSNVNYYNKANVFFIKKYSNLGFVLDDMHNSFKIKKYLNSIIDSKSV